VKFVMLDTNVVIDLMRNETKALEKLKDFKGYTFVISFLVYAEVMAGSQLTQKVSTRKFLKQFAIKPFDSKAHATATKLLDKYFTGRENKPTDLLIASHAHSQRIPIITNNAKDFIFKDVKVYHYTKSFWV
jgi:predicted nucleic acid-binding protein